MTIAKTFNQRVCELRPIQFFLMALFLCMIMGLLRWPGILTVDGYTQIEQAQTGNYRDWQPPIMAWIWHFLLPFGTGPGPMFLLQLVTFWLGIGIFSAYLSNIGKNIHALLMLAVGYSPIAFFYIGVIRKDVCLCAFFVLAFAIVVWERPLGRYFGWLVGVLAMLFRANGVFAVGPLFLLSWRTKSILSLALISGLISAPLLLASQFINHDVIKAERSGVEKSLQIYDLVGIAFYSGDESVLPVEIENIRSCYTPLFWDTLYTDRCGKPFEKLPESIMAEWLGSISARPVAYLQHRLAHFNYETFFLVPFAQQCVEAPELHDCPRSLVSSFVTHNAFLWPITWLVLGCVMLIFGMSPIPKMLCLSGILYGLGYLVVGVAADFRYFLWTEIAVQISFVLQMATGGISRPKALLAAVGATWVIGYAWRFLIISGAL